MATAPKKPGNGDGGNTGSGGSPGGSGGGPGDAVNPDEFRTAPQPEPAAPDNGGGRLHKGWPKGVPRGTKHGKLPGSEGPKVPQNVGGISGTQKALEEIHQTLALVVGPSILLTKEESLRLAECFNTVEQYYHFNPIKPQHQALFALGLALASIYGRKLPAVMTAAKAPKDQAGGPGEHQAQPPVPPVVGGPLSGIQTASPVPQGNDWLTQLGMATQPVVN